jgi:hypothetical protein
MLYKIDFLKYLFKFLGIIMFNSIILRSRLPYFYHKIYDKNLKNKLISFGQYLRTEERGKRKEERGKRKKEKGKK